MSIFRLLLDVFISAMMGYYAVTGDLAHLVLFGFLLIYSAIGAISDNKNGQGSEKMFNENRALYRGKRVDNGEWVEGYLSKGRLIGYKHSALQPCIDREDKGVMISSVVDPETIGQYTGLTDKDGNKIFEGDVVKWGHISSSEESPIRIAKVVIDPDIQYHSQIGIFHHGCFAYANTTGKYLEIIGNVIDNPELLEAPHEE